jgi:predicted amidohydrolase
VSDAGDGAWRVTCAQIAVEAADVPDNVDRAVAAVERAARDGADLVVLPEVFTVGYFAFDAYARTAEPLDGATMTRLAATADAADCHLLAGTFVEDLAATAERVPDADPPATEGYANTAVLFDRDGARRAVYRKHHLFGYGSAEAELLTPGESLGVADLGGLTVGVTTCYDLRFPELYRALAERGVDLVRSRARGPTRASSTGSCSPGHGPWRTSATSPPPTAARRSRRRRWSVGRPSTTPGGRRWPRRARSRGW